MPRTPVIQVRTWIATLHGCQEDTDYDEWMRRCFEGGHCKYICGQLERGEDTGRLHLQFMVQFDRSKRLNGVRAAISEQAHWEPVHGSTVQCKAYVTKEATRVAGPWEYGALAAAGKRRGLDEAVDSVKAGVPLHEVAAEYSLAWVSHGKGLTSLRQMLKLDADRRSFGPAGPEVWVLWGPSGTGKSRWVAATWPDAFWKSPESKWWDGYSGQETVVLDDFKDYAMPLVELQRLLDWYPLGRGQGRQCAHAGQEVCPYGEYFARGLVPQGRCPPHDMAPCDRLCGQARPPDPLCGRLDAPYARGCGG